MRTAARLAPHASLPAMCRALGRDHWGRQPVVLGRAEHVLGDADDLYAGLRALGQRGEIPRIYVDGKPVAPTAADACGASDPSIEAYLQRLSRAHGATEITYIAKHVQTSHERIWFGCGRLLGALYAEVGFPAGDASLMLFAGKYGRTPFGCHKDAEDVITYVVSGRKRFLVWPFEVVARHLNIPEAVRYQSVILESFDYNVLRDQAILLEGEPGDLLYWPWDHWHVAEADGQFTANLSLAVAPHAGTRRAGDGGGAAPREVSLEERLDRRTRFGFRQLLPVAAGATFHDADWLRPALPALIAWEQQPDRLVVSVNGYGFSVDPRPGLIDVLAELARGEPVQVGALKARYCANGDGDGDGGGGDGDDLEQILDCLLTFHAFAHEPAVASPLSPELLHRSDWHPLHLAGDGSTVDLARVAEDQHRVIEGGAVPGCRTPLDEILALYDAQRPIGRRPRYVFTAGYCGSTLISRCIEAIAQCWTVNEPRVLDDWAARDGALGDDARGAWRRVLDLVTVLLFRSNHPEGKVVVKGGEGATGIMEELLVTGATGATGPRATGLLLYASLPTFLASTLKAETRRAEFRRVVRSLQRARMARRLGLPAVDPAALSDARAIAYVWSTDLALYRHVRGRVGGRLCALDFDAFLDEPGRGIRALADHFELGLAPDGEQEIGAGELFRTHAKRPDAATFDRHARRTALAAQHDRHRDEIDDALRWSRALWGAEPPARLPGDLLAVTAPRSRAAAGSGT